MSADLSSKLGTGIRQYEDPFNADCLRLSLKKKEEEITVLGCENADHSILGCHASPRLAQHISSERGEISPFTVKPFQIKGSM